MRLETLARPVDRQALSFSHRRTGEDESRTAPCVLLLPPEEDDGTTSIHAGQAP